MKAPALILIFGGLVVVVVLTIVLTKVAGGV